jgi:triacylglycerol lipase
VAPSHHVLLVPGFFGFANLGDFAYFGHVRDFLAEVGPSLGLRGEVRVVRTVPMASLPKRAVLLAQSVAEVLEAAGGMVSIVGHSSGGLDARLAVSPAVSLPSPVEVEPCARSVRAVVTVATPHFGTPVAHLFNTLLGQQLLRLLSLSTMHALRAGRLPIRVVLRLSRLLRRPDSRPSGLLDQLFVQLLADFSKDRRRGIEEFFASLGTDQDLLAQITPAGMDVFNASTQDRPGVRYGCVVTRARPPGLRSTWRAGFDGYAQATHALYAALSRVASGTTLGREPRLRVEQAAVLRRTYGRIPDLRANDGIVPTLSQIWGDVVAAAWADHHDVIGHFHGPTHVPPHFDWVASGTGFDRAQFEAVWRAVAVYLAAAGDGRDPGARAPRPRERRPERTQASGSSS